MQTPGDWTWPKSFTDPQPRSPETPNATQAGKSTCKIKTKQKKKVIIYSLTPIIEVNGAGYSAVIEALALASRPCGANRRGNAEQPNVAHAAFRRHPG